MTYEKFELQSKAGERLRCDIRYKPDKYHKPVVLFLHGFKGFKDWGPFPAAMEWLAEEGFVAVSFNFSHNGVGADLQNFSELDRFSANTFSRELDETLDVIEEIRNMDNIPASIEDVDSQSIGLLGHSRGGGIAILAGRWSPDIKAVAALSPVSNFDRYTARQKEKWRREGAFKVQNMRTKQMMNLNLSLLDDIEQHQDRLSILNAAEEIGREHKPFLIVSGAQDMTTKPAEAEAIATAAKSPETVLELIPATGHTFGAEHPFSRSNPALQQVFRTTFELLQARPLTGRLHESCDTRSFRN